MVLDPRAYWTDRMEAAYAFMQRLLEYPVRECGEPLRCLRRQAAEVGVDMVFPADRKLGLFDRLFLVRSSLIDGLLAVGEGLLQRGFVLRVEDGYRPPERQARGATSDYALRHVLAKVRWELCGRMPSAELVFRRLSVWTATTPKFANHTAGCAVDVMLLRRGDRTPIDLGAPYPELSHLTPMDSPFVPDPARRHRELLCGVFAEQGFIPYPFEFWHFSRGDADCEMMTGAGAPARFGPVHWSDKSGQVTPVADPTRPFVTIEDIRDRLPALGAGA
jgi:D-alanyl-D-alanine dipeptidase